jgi:hypothetical protein
VSGWSLSSGSTGHGGVVPFGDFRASEGSAASTIMVALGCEVALKFVDASTYAHVSSFWRVRRLSRANALAAVSRECFKGVVRLERLADRDLSSCFSKVLSLIRVSYRSYLSSQSLRRGQTVDAAANP